ncbi:MAG: universal stress protein [Pseudomonadota bacterium]
MKTIALMLDAAAGDEGCLAAALDLARSLHGHLICVDAPARRDRRRAIDERLAREQVSWEWSAAAGEPGTIAESVYFADILVTGPPAGNLFDPSLPRFTADTAVARHAPVLVVPDDRDGIAVSGNVLVAWDGSHAALAALRCAVPLLALSSEVQILEIDDRSAGPSASSAARYLGHHGIAATIESIHSLHRPTCDLIETHAQSIDAAYIVMGAFGHNRVREVFLGGVTRSMLDKSSYPLFLAH